MTQFGTDVTSAEEVPSFVTPKEGVSRQTPLSEGLAETFGKATQMLSANRESANQRSVGDFTRRQLLVADAYAQGRLPSSAAAKTRMRHNLLDAIDANPAMAKELMQAQAAIGVFGAADIVEKGTREEQVRFARQDALIQSGYLDSDDTSEAGFQKADNESRRATESKRRYDEVMRDINLERKSYDLTDARRKELKAQEKEEAGRFVRDTAPAELKGMKATFEQVLAASGTEAEKVEAIKQQFIAFQGQIAATLGDLDAQQSGAMMAPFDQMRDLYLQKARGEIVDAELERGIERAINIQTKVLAADPLLVGVAAASKMGLDMGPGSARLETEVFSRVTQLVASNSGSTEVEVVNPFKTGATEEKALKDYLRQVDEALESGDQEKIAGAADNFNTYLDSIVQFETRIKRDPKSAMSMISVMASPTFMKALSKNPELLTNREEAADILREHYEEEVWGMVEREFLDKKVDVGAADDVTPGAEGPTDIRALVTTVATSSGMEFRAISPENRDSVILAKSLNKELKPIINETVQAFAHLEGSTDYKAQWERASETLLRGQSLSGGDAGDDLTLDSFDDTEGGQAVDTVGLPKSVAEDTDFVSEVGRVSAKYGMNPSVLMGIMDFETGGSFDPAQKNAAGSSGTGLIQFMANTAKGLGTSTASLASMSRAEQMKWVDKYLGQYASKLKGASAADAYMSILYPKAIDKPGSYVLFKKGTLAYTQNKGLDRNGDGTVTKDEAAAKVIERVKKYETT